MTQTKTIVVKIGSSTLAAKSGKLDHDFMGTFCKEMAHFQKMGKQFILVTSGAIIAGSERLGKVGRLRTIPEKQAASAVGQSLLMHAYETIFHSCGITIAQVLLTRDAISDRHRYIHVRHTFEELLRLNVIPIINENDPVSVDEIKVGDNDTLAALVASLIGADLLVLFTDVEGLRVKGKIVDVVENNLDEIIQGIVSQKTTKSIFGTGGILTKLEAAKVAGGAGIPMIIAQGRKEKVLSKIVEGEKVGTLFVPRENKLDSRKRWLAHGLPATGSIVVDGGAAEALLTQGRSLLPVGVREVEGEFEPGDVIRIVSAGKEVARGLSNYGSQDILKIKGKRASEIEKLLGYHAGDEIVHRDNLVLL